VRITEFSRLHGVEVGELRLPPGVSVSLVVRTQTSFTPDRRTVLQRGDDLLIVSPRGLREQTESRLQLLSRSGRLGRWAQSP
jgi:cell volume regulation protein A